VPGRDIHSGDVASFLLIRHGEAEYGLAEERRLKGMGRDLVPLTPAGVQQVEELAKAFPEPLTLLISSPMTRALQSTAILAARLSVPLQVEFDLHEWMPDLGCTYDSVDAVVRAHAEYVDQRGEWRPGIRCAWEPRSKVIERVGDVLHRYSSTPGTVGVVCHGVVIEALTGEAAERASWTHYRPGAA
jgi:broad specificity phosphatase PhoE